MAYGRAFARGFVRHIHALYFSRTRKEGHTSPRRGGEFDLRSHLRCMQIATQGLLVQLEELFLNSNWGVTMFHRKKLSILVSGAILIMGGAAQARAATTNFDNFTPLAGSVPAGS